MKKIYLIHKIRNSPNLINNYNKFNLKLLNKICSNNNNNL